ncbi:MAG: 50S ribosomal protein L29 [Deltaproteobacteria bacterium]|nr:50S ribosomal protein L29 [Deltaproteobacteria bacterium]
MEAKEVREFSDDELRVKLVELRESLFLLRLRQGTNQLESPAKLKQTRRDIARILTTQRSRSLGRKN